MSSEGRLLEDDEQARRDAIDVTRSFIVQAPAGSGKTELLIQRYLRLLTTVNDPEEVLAITFTRKAAAEMKLRVLEALRREAEKRPVDAPHMELTAAFARDALTRSRDLGWDLLGSPRRMRILTLDALNASLARARPLASDISTSGRTILVDADLRSIHRDAARATLDWLPESLPGGAAAHEVLAHLDNHTGPYIDYLATMLSTRDQWLPFIGSGLFDEHDADALRDIFESSLHQVVVTHLQQTQTALEPYEQIAEVFDYAATNLIADSKPDHPIARLGGVSNLPGVLPDDLPEWLGVAELLMVQSGEQFRKTVNKNIGILPGKSDEKALIESMLEALADNTEAAALLGGVRLLPPVRYTDEQWQVLVAMFRLLPLAVIELRRLFAEHGVADHIEVALAADHALGTPDEPGDLALLLDYQVSHILVDEMQDTSIAQYRMLEALTGGWEAGDGRTLFCVGDPMQSIYRFRNAEVGQFLFAREKGIGHVGLIPLVLRRNFRSGEVLVEWFNKVFPDVLAARNDASRGAVAYESAVSADHLKQQGRICVHPVVGNHKGAEADTGVRVIRELVEQFPDEEVAVLVQGRSQLPQLLQGLRSAAINYSAIEIDRLTDLPEIIDVLALTRAATHPGDRIAWLGVLRSASIGLTLSDLHVLSNSDQNSTMLELLSDPDRIAALTKEGRDAIELALPHLLEMLAPAPASSLSERVERCWMMLGGPATLAQSSEVNNVSRFFELIRRNEVGGLLRDSAELESILDAERVSTSGSSKLQVMTMHRAKGLQFDHVILYGLGRQPGGGGSELLSWFDVPSQSGTAARIISPIGPRADVERDPIHRFISATQKARNSLEEGRLLYVACTRAQQSLHIVGNVGVSREGDSLRPARKDSLLRFLWHELRPEFERAFGTYVHDQDVREAPEWFYPQRKILESAWSLPVTESPGIAETANATTEAQFDDTPVDFYWVGTDARIAGTLVHRWLQLLTEGRGKTESDLLRSITERWLQEMGIGADSQSPILDRVEAAVSAVLDDEQGRWCIEGEGHAELALSGIDDGELVSVVLDRVRIDQGQHWIVDYKTSSHEGGNLDGFLDVEVARYRPQLARYARLYGAWSGEQPRCALYFPLLSKFVEVDVA